MISTQQIINTASSDILTSRRGNSSAMGETDLRHNDHDIAGVKKLLWGDNIKEDVFRRWSQGFHFSHAEPSALVQNEGGPCAVIAPVQGFILKILLAEIPGHCFPDLTPEKSNSLLVRAVCNILAQSSSHSYKVVLLNRSRSPPGEEGCSNHPDNADILNNEELSTEEAPDVRSEIFHSDTFHERLQVECFEGIQEVKQFYVRNFGVLTDKYGVLLFLYSVILSKGVENVKSELSDLSDPLIHAVYGYGSQGLINLMLTGRAVGHVWDDVQHVGGLRLCGIDRQPDVGFITIMEHMQYCTVGSFYKNPKNPVWVMGSETHLTVLFSYEKKLVSPETAAESAKRIFRSFDPDGNNFIQSVLLQDLLCAMDLVSDPEYVDIMRKKLDAENLGIILLNAFMDEFFSGQQRSTPDTFSLLHYNGLARSNVEGCVAYRNGSAVRLEGDLRAASEDPMLTCLQTKWPGLEVSWTGGKPPSLN